MTSLSPQYTALNSIHSIRVFTTVSTYDVDKAARSTIDICDIHSNGKVLTRLQLAKSTLLKSLPKMCLRTMPHVAAAASLYKVSRLASVDCGATRVCVRVCNIAVQHIVTISIDKHIHCCSSNLQTRARFRRTLLPCKYYQARASTATLVQ
jgi:hypothetical protein